MDRILVINGPNLNMLGIREPHIYGYETLADVEADLVDFGTNRDIEIETFQSNHEGDIIDRIQEARETSDGIVINGGALTHYSYAVYDALVAVGLPSIEIHISNIHAREPWRAVSVTGPASLRTIYGRGLAGYTDAILALVRLHDHPPTTMSYGDDPANVIDVRTPDSGGNKLAVLIHGGFWRDQWQRDTIDGLAIDLARRGWIAANIEYRRVGSGGGWPTTGDDILAALDHLIEEHDPHHVTAIGHSAGGQLAMWAAAELPHTIDEVVSLAGVLDLSGGAELGDGAVTAFMGGAPTENPDAYFAASPIGRIPAARQIIVHGSDDTAVPPAMSRAYAAAATAAGASVTPLEFAGVDHMDLVDPSHPSWSAVIEALEAFEG